MITQERAALRAALEAWRAILRHRYTMSLDEKALLSVRHSQALWGIV
jgi:hypothetical protein